MSINYTYARNLKKTQGMETGQVSFHRPNEVMFIKIEKDAPVVKTLMKSKREEYPDLKKQLEEHKAEIAKKEREETRKQIDQAKAEKKATLAAEKEKSDFFK